MGRKILVIDDEPDVLEIVQAILITRGHDVTTAPGGAEGLDLAEVLRPDLIICDLMMPRVSGLEVLKRLRRSQTLRTTPVMIISALGDEKRPPDFWVKSLGVDDYLQKPFDPLDLLGRVEYILRRNIYVSTKGEEGGRMESEQTRAPMDLQDSTPREVVTAFVEAWNRQDFATEFQCLGDEMIGSVNQHDYVERRRRAYLDERSQNRHQRVSAVVEEKVSLNVAKVVIDRVDRVDGDERQRRETYTLKKTHKGWKIIICRSTPMPAQQPAE